MRIALGLVRLSLYALGVGLAVAGFVALMPGLVCLGLSEACHKAEEGLW